MEVNGLLQFESNGSTTSSGQNTGIEWVAIPFSRDLPETGIEPGSPALQADSLPSEPPGKPQDTL